MEETWGAVVEAARSHAGEDGTVHLTNLVLTAVGRA